MTALGRVGADVIEMLEVPAVTGLPVHGQGVHARRRGILDGAEQKKKSQKVFHRNIPCGLK